VDSGAVGLAAGYGERMKWTIMFAAPVQITLSDNLFVNLIWLGKKKVPWDQLPTYPRPIAFHYPSSRSLNESQLMAVSGVVSNDDKDRVVLPSCHLVTTNVLFS